MNDRILQSAQGIDRVLDSLHAVALFVHEYALRAEPDNYARNNILLEITLCTESLYCTGKVMPGYEKWLERMHDESQQIDWIDITEVRSLPVLAINVLRTKIRETELTFCNMDENPLARRILQILNQLSGAAFVAMAREKESR